MEKYDKDSAYEDLFFNKPKDYELMKNSANALLLQFEKPLKHDLTIPRFYNIKTGMHILNDSFNGVKIDSLRVNCTTGSNYPVIITFDFCGKFPKKVEKGLELCFTQYDKYDNPPLEVHLNIEESIFGHEGNFYRFRNGKREEVKKEVEKYFNKSELKAFEEIGKFIIPYVNLADASCPVKQL